VCIIVFKCFGLEKCHAGGKKEVIEFPKEIYQGDFGKNPPAFFYRLWHQPAMDALNMIHFTTKFL